MTTVLGAPLQEVEVDALDAARFEPLVGPERMARFEAVAEATRQRLGNRAVVNVNSTAVGGGVAEMLQTLLAYARGAGVDTRWLVIRGDAGFFAITKRIHNGLYGGPGDGGELGEAERGHYEAVARRNAEGLLDVLAPDDVVLLHDPQTAGLAPSLLAAGRRVIWRCHVGVDEPNPWSDRSWEFLRPYLEGVDAYVFSRPEFAPPWAEREKTFVVPPSIDPFSAKNEPMSVRTVRLALGYAGLVEGAADPPVVPFTRRDGTRGRITRRCDLVQLGPPPPADAPLVVQASRWDGMKDMAGVMEGFAEYVDPSLGAHLVLAGPAVTGVADDPEAAEVYADCIRRWRRLSHEARSRVHLACTPMTDPDEAAALVNALQRHATIACQKSLAEGFGLTVAEAMWKGTPVVASAVGGIVNQIEDGEQGLLVSDPRDLEAFGNAVEALLRDPAEAGRLGRNARERATRELLGDTHLALYADVLGRLLT
ncbi:MAG: glycosyltransferase [Thermoleophilia bacterium]|nr:glycosyltransferase [Thermoleophilia bacterium]